MPDPRARAKVLVASAAGLCGIAAALLISRSSVDGPDAGTVVVVALLAAGAVAARTREPTRRAGWLCAWAAVAVLGAEAIGWQGGPMWVRAAGVLLAPLLVPVLAHLVLLNGRGSLRGRTAVWVVAAVYGLTILLTGGIALVRDPLRDLACQEDCDVRVLAVSPLPALAQALAEARLGLTLVVSVGAAAVAVRRVRRLPTQSIPAAAALALLVEGVGAARLLGWTRTPSLTAVEAAREVALSLVGLALVWTVADLRRRRLAVAGLGALLGPTPPPGTLAAELRRLTGDPTLDVAFWLPHEHRFVDAWGKDVGPVEPGRSRAVLRRGDDQLAVVTFERAGEDELRLGELLGSSARLAIDNERLQAERLAQLDALVASRERIVDAADTLRRRIERDLHDGAQADLVAVLYTVSAARVRAARAEDEVSERYLEELAGTVSEIAARLREMTHGVYPAVLTDLGLEPALWALGDVAPGALVLDVDIPTRAPSAVERVAYLVATDAVHRAPDGTPVELSAAMRGTLLHLTVHPYTVPPGVALADRIGAVRGTGTHHGTRLEVDLPCA
ncbi:histidine kinase [Cellulomonas sp. P5_C6]